MAKYSVGKALEHRSALTPTTTKALLDAGYAVNIERSPERIFDDSEFEKVGATLVPENTWREAPEDHIIVGLKELPEETCTLTIAFTSPTTSIKTSTSC
jgi:saccharopine dehydrogenase (NAD+, L-lysine-forming)